MARKTAGIMTFHWVANYGAVLQSWALQNYLSSIGIDAELIDYVPKGMNASLLRCIKARRPRRVPLYFEEYRKEKYIEVFRKKYLKRSVNRYEYKEELLKEPPEYDYYISGSDQIWNPFFTMNKQRGITLSYYLDFAPENAKRVAFSSSFGLSNIPDAMREAILPELTKFSSISVRENAGIGILKSMGITGVQTVDPTLLLQAEDYKSLLKPVHQKKSSCFFYCLHGQKKYAITAVQEYANQENLCLIEDECKGIEEWLSHISNADFVVTNSFHGAVFCILFHVPFMVFEKKTGRADMGNRLSTLLESVGLAERFCPLDKLTECLNQIKGKTIDWQEVDCLVKELRSKAKNYLRTALEISSVHTAENIDINKCIGEDCAK